MEKTFLTNNIIWYAFYSKIAAFDNSEKNSFFLEKASIFLKKQVSLVFEISYYFNRILRQICYNLVIENFQSQKQGIPLGLLASKRKKNALLWVNDFPSIL